MTYFQRGYERKSDSRKYDGTLSMHYTKTSYGLLTTLQWVPNILDYLKKIITKDLS